MVTGRNKSLIIPSSTAGGTSLTAAMNSSFYNQCIDYLISCKKQLPSNLPPLLQFEGGAKAWLNN